MLKLTKVDSVVRPVAVRLPTEQENVFNEGTIRVRFKIKSKDEVVELSKLADREFIANVVTEVIGLGNDQGEALTGQAALAEVQDGLYSAYLQQAIVAEYWDHFGDARAKNSRTSRGR